MGRDTLKSWCFKGQFEGKKPFVFGSVRLPLDATFETVLEEGAKAWNKIMPISVPPSWHPVEGMIWFEGETE